MGEREIEKERTRETERNLIYNILTWEIVADRVGTTDYLWMLVMDRGLVDNMLLVVFSVIDTRKFRFINMTVHRLTILYILKYQLA